MKKHYCAIYIFLAVFFAAFPQVILIINFINSSGINIFTSIILMIAGLILSLFFSKLAIECTKNHEIDTTILIRDMIIQMNANGEIKPPQINSVHLEYLIKNIYSQLNIAQKHLSKKQKDVDKFNFLFELMPDGIITINQNGDVITINQAAIDIFHVKESDHENVSQFVFDARIVNCIKKAFQELGQPEEFLMNRDKTNYLVSVTGVLLNDDFPYAFIHLRNITTVTKAEHTRRDFVANVSHELKTPLTSIQGFVELLENDLVPDKNTKQKYYTQIHLEVIHLIELINDILKLSQLESIAINEELTVFPVDNEINKASKLLRQKAEEKGVIINIQTEPNVLLRANPDKIYELVLNLMENSIKYNNPGGIVTVKSYKEENSKNGESFCVIQVEDNGIGIPAELQDRIFERFYRVDTGRSQKIEGSGLGLSIVKHIVSLYGGHIGLESTPGKGTKIKILIPLANL